MNWRRCRPCSVAWLPENEWEKNNCPFCMRPIDPSDGKDAIGREQNQNPDPKPPEVSE